MAKDDLIVAVKGSKTQQSQQLKELEGKARTELALLEDVRDYMKVGRDFIRRYNNKHHTYCKEELMRNPQKRADIEKDYFEKLEKLSKSLSPKNKGKSRDFKQVSLCSSNRAPDKSSPIYNPNHSVQSKTPNIYL